MNTKNIKLNTGLFTLFPQEKYMFFIGQNKSKTLQGSHVQMYGRILFLRMFSVNGKCGFFHDSSDAIVTFPETEIRRQPTRVGLFGSFRD